MKLDVLFMNLHRRYLNISAKVGGFLGNYYLSAYLLDNGYKAKGYSGTLKDGKMILDELCANNDIKMLGLYLDYDNVTENIYISRYVKENYHIPVIIGGPQADALNIDFYEKSQCDAVVIGEGELTVYELTKFFISGKGKLEDILGIRYLNNSKIIRNPSRPLIENLDDLPFITENCYLEPAYFYNQLNIMTGRGCPFHCAFCHEGIGKSVRFRSVENILDEIDEYLEKYDGDELRIFFTDDTFTLNAERVKAICEGLRLRNQNHCSIRFFCEGHVHTLYKNPEMLKYLADGGCYRLQLGIEAGTDEILKLYGKNSTTNEILEVTRLACDLGIKQIVGNMIVGGAFFNNDVFEADKKFVKELLNVGKGVVEIGVVTFWPLPNTPMTKNPEKFGIKICDDEFLTSLGEFPQAETRDLDRLDIAEKQYELEIFIENEMKFLLKSKKIPTSVVLDWFCQANINHHGAWFALLGQMERLFAFYEMIYLGEGVESKDLTDLENARPMRVGYLYHCLTKVSNDTVLIDGEEFTGKDLEIVTLTTGKLSVKEIAERVSLSVSAVKKVLDRLENMGLIVYTLY